MSEQSLLKRFLLEYSKLGSRLFRNNTGQGWVGERIGPVKKPGSIQLRTGDVVLRGARPFHAGLQKGSSDLIGWTIKEITPDMVGRKVAIFTAVEVKTGSLKATKQQQNFVDQVETSGGIGVIAYSIQDLLNHMSKFEGVKQNETRH